MRKYTISLLQVYVRVTFQICAEFLSCSDLCATVHARANSYEFLQGSSKSGYLGEASIDFADFADEPEPLTVSLPLKFANSGAVLHVSSLFLPPSPSLSHTHPCNSLDWTLALSLIHS